MKDEKSIKEIKDTNLILNLLMKEDCWVLYWNLAGRI